MGGHCDKNLFPGVLDNKLPKDQRKITAEENYGFSTGNTTFSSPGESIREMLTNQATTDEVKGIINELYRPGAKVGDGGTADAIRKQLQTNEPVGGRDHIRKGQERLKQIKRLLSRFPNHPDRNLLEKLRDDLSDALGEA